MTRLVRELGGELRVIEAEDPVEAVLSLAYQQHVTQIVVFCLPWCKPFANEPRGLRRHGTDLGGTKPGQGGTERHQTTQDDTGSPVS